MSLRSNAIIDTDTSIEVFMDNVIEVGTSHAREILTYDDPEFPQIEEIARNRQLQNVVYAGSFQNDIIDKSRKLNYLVSYASKVIVIDGGNRNAIYGNVTPLSYGNKQQNNIEVSFTAVAKGGITGQYIPIADVTSTGTTTADITAVDGFVEVLDAISENAYYNLTQTVYELPEGDYKMFARVKDTAQVADDVKLEVYNNTDAGSIASDTFTATAAYGYMVLDFTISSTDLGDSIKFLVEKTTAGVNAISLDFVGFVKV